MRKKVTTGNDKDYLVLILNCERRSTNDLPIWIESLFITFIKASETTRRCCIGITYLKNGLFKENML